jgi:hypothetical protein
MKYFIEKGVMHKFPKRKHKSFISMLPPYGNDL